MTRSVIKINEEVIYERISRNNSNVDFFRIVKWNDLKFKILFHVNHYPHQSFMKVDMYYHGKGWREILESVLPTHYSLAHVSMKDITNESVDDEAYKAFEWDCYQLLTICRKIIS